MEKVSERLKAMTLKANEKSYRTYEKVNKLLNIISDSEENFYITNDKNKLFNNNSDSEKKCYITNTKNIYV